MGMIGLGLVCPEFDLGSPSILLHFFLGVEMRMRNRLFIFPFFFSQRQDNDKVSLICSSFRIFRKGPEMSNLTVR